MREIKFRIWDNEFKQMCQVSSINSLDEDNPRKIEACGLTSPSGYRDVSIDFPLRQFTGLQDAKGNDIYEGDIVNYSFDGVLFIDNGTYVIFQNGAFVIKRPNFCPLVSDTKWIEITGNIYEHPELLNPFTEIAQL